MKRIIALLAAVTLLVSCNTKTFFGAGYGKTYSSEPTEVIDSVLSSHGLSNDAMKWNTKTYTDNSSNGKSIVLVSTMLCRMDNDSTLIMTMYHQDGKYRLNWRIEKEPKIKF